MRKGLFLLGATAAVLSSCSNQEVVDMADYANQPIEFSTFVGKNTRAGDVTNANFQKFWVFAQNKGASDDSWAEAFTNVQVNKGGSNIWSPINTYYWEAHKEFRFAGYANGEKQLDNTVVSYDAGATNGGTTGLLTFKEYSTTGQDDLVAAMGDANDYTWDGTSGEAPAVGMTFRHMLSKLTFTFKTNMANTYTVKVSNLRIENAVNKSTGTYHKDNNGTIAWNSSGISGLTTGTYEFEEISNVTADAADETGYFSQASAPLYVIPQSCGSLKVAFSVEVTNQAGERVGEQDFIADLGYTPSQSESSLKQDEWTAGYYYNYTAELKMEDLNTDENAKPIKFTVDVDEWKPTTAGDGLDLTENNN